MAENLVLIVSNDKDFSLSVAEQVQKELAVTCKVAQTPEEAKAYTPSVVVTSEDMDAPCPQVKPRQKPLRLRELLADIAAALQKTTDDGMIVSRDYVLQIRQKQLMHGPSGKSVGLTDKEAQLLVNLAQAGRTGLAKETLLRQVWGFEAVLDTHTLETHIYRLRTKFRELAGDDTMIIAAEGGYTLKDQ